MRPSDTISLPENNALEPEPTPHPLLCEWRIVATQGERIQLNITALDLPESDDCQKETGDYLEIRDGHYLRSPLIGKIHGN